jgi:hypothetical protein
MSEQSCFHIRLLLAYFSGDNTLMPSAGFEPAIPATKRPQTYALDSAATGIGGYVASCLNYLSSYKLSILLCEVRACGLIHQLV